MAADKFDDDQTRSIMTLAAGTNILHYKIITNIGIGGMGEVYLAEDTELDRQVALKFLLPNLCQDDDCRLRFKREAQAAAKLNHPNIISIHEVNEFNNRPFFVMDFVEGQSLKELSIAKELAIDQIIEIAIQICDALNFAHQKGIIHRDIKPSNIMIDAYGRPLLVDYGLAMILDKEQLTKTGSTMGTVGFMSPEQIEGKKTDGRSDLFSLGVILYELIAGRAPFQRDNQVATLKAVLHDPPEPLSRYKNNVPDELQRSVVKLLEKDPLMRYQSAAEIISDLKRLTKRHEISTTKSSKWHSKQLPLWASAGIIAIVLAITLTWFWPEDQAEPKNNRKMLAVLPFENLGDADVEYFADGITDEIISRLAAIKKLGVISRTSAYAFKNTNKTIPVIAEELGVDFILEGTIRWDRTGDTDRVRITPQLIRVKDDVHLWATNYDRPLTQIFALQTDIAENIVDGLGITLGAIEDQRLHSNPADNLEAYNLYLKGAFFLSKQTVEGFRQGKEYFDKALVIDSNFALAWAGLSVYHTFVLMTGGIPVEQTYPSARFAADKALQLDSLSPEAHIAMGWINSHMEWDWVNAEIEFKKALELSPGHAFAHVAYATFLLLLSRNDEALAEMETALVLDPLSPFVNQVYGWAYYISGQPDKAITQFHKTLELDPHHIWARTQLAWSYAFNDMYPEALAHCDTVLQIQKPEFDPWLYSSLASIHAKTGNQEPARQTLATLEKAAKITYIDPFNFACMYANLNEFDRAFMWLEKSIDARSINVLELMRPEENKFFLQNICDDPRYQKLVKHMDSVRKTALKK